MNIDGYGFHFEGQGRSGEEGPIDPSQQYFEGRHAGDAVVRETGQNSLDNRGQKADGPIRMEFELATMPTNNIPGIDELREHLDAVADQTDGQQGHDRMVAAAGLAKQEELDVLRVSDYNTTGLTGSESLSAPGSALNRLTRGKGGSEDDERGGSFGIGSAVGPMASQLCTVLYVSLPEDSDETVFAGYTRLATHELGGERYRAEGYFTKKDEPDFSYLRPAPQIGSFPRRTEPGTDIYILGYRMAGSDPKLRRVRDAVIDNFMAAIHGKRLVVKGRTPSNNWVLDDTSLEGYAKQRPDSHAMYLALKDPDPAIKDIPHVGKASLYVNVDDRLDKKLHTITMRAPLMKIDIFRHNSISAKYAAVLICDNEKGNKYLRGLEPPQHHAWDAARDPYNGRAVIKALKNFVRDALKERISNEIGDVVEIDGLARYLPTETVSNATSAPPSAPTSVPDSIGTDEESSSVKGKPKEEKDAVKEPNKKVNVKVRRPAVSGNGEQETQRGRKSGGDKSRQHKGGPMEDRGEDGDGTSRIHGRALRFRSWCSPGSSPEFTIIALAITPEKDDAGDLELVALGPGGDPENDFTLPISRVVLHKSDNTEDIDFSGNTIKNIALEGGKMTRIDIHVPVGERYRLGAV